jgi:DNA polymerase-1
VLGVSYMGAAARAAANPVAEPASVDHAAYVRIQDLETLNAWVAKATAKGIVAFDTETDALSSATAGLCGVSLAIAPGEACYIPVGHCEKDGLALEAAADLVQIPLDQAIAALKPLLEDPAVLKIAQNAKYDIAVLARHGIDVGPIEDTMLISYVLEAGLHGHGMDELSELWLGHKPIPFKQVAGSGKGQISFKHVGLAEATAYAAEDADVTLRLYNVLKPRLAAEGLLTVYETLERPLPDRAGGHGERRHPRRSRHPAPALQRVLDAHGRVRGPGPGTGRPSVQPGQPQADRRRAVRRDGPEGRQEDRHRPVVDRQRRAGGPGQLSTSCRACCSTGASCPS